MKALKSYVKRGGFFKAVVEDGSDLIFIVDYKGQILYHNASVKETLGYRPNSLVGKNFFSYILPAKLKSFKKDYSNSTRKRYNQSVEFQFLCKDGVYKYLEFNSINLRQTEKINGLILDCRDITQRKEDAEELLRAQKAKELFLANVSHEIRTPINGIAGMAALLQQNPEEKDKAIYLNAISSAAENLKVIINDILDLASIESGKLQFEEIGFNPSDLLKSLIDTFQVQASEKKISLHFFLQPEANRILIGDPVRLNQILINLLSNAIKFTHHGSISINCFVEREEASKVITRFEVKDTGIGIPKDKLSKIFDSFSQADASITRKYGGTGLGLTIVKQLAELQNGSIQVKSKEDLGSTFIVRLPYKIGDAGNIPEHAGKFGKSKTLNSLKLLKVLLVEDNDINRLYASSILKSWGCICEQAENGFVAVEKVKNHDFDIALMDIQMPVLDGFEATRQIRALVPAKSKIPIIALTANATQKDVEKCLEEGMNDCISKPFTPEDLYKTLTKFIPTDLDKRSAPSTTLSGKTVDLSYLKEVSNNNQTFIQEMVETFLSTIPKSIEEIQSSTKSKNYEALAKAVHKIKPSLTLIGLSNLKDQAAEIESKARQKKDIIKLETAVTDFCKSLLHSMEELKTVTF